MAKPEKPESLFLETLQYGRPPGSHTPVWIMRQAGRYSPAFLELRAGMPFLDFCKQPELCLKATMIPMRELAVDAAILFADILLIPEALGQPLSYEPGKGPVFGWPVRTPGDIAKLSMDRFRNNIGYVYEAVRMIRNELPADKALIGFAGAPFTVGSYMVEGQSSKDHRHIKGMMWDSESGYHDLMQMITDATIEYLKAQIEHGAQALQLFDTWLDTLCPADITQFVEPYVLQIIDAIKPTGVPLIYFGKGLGKILPWLDAYNCDGFSLDWTVDLQQFSAHFGNSKALQGNLDPACLYAPREIITQQVGRVLESAREHPRHIFNLGHGLAPDMELSKVQFLVDEVHRLSQAL